MTPVFDADATAALIDVHLLIEAVADAAVAFDDGAIVCPERTVLPMVDGALLLSMPAAASDIAIHKLITVAPCNAARGLATIVGTVTIVDPSSGEVVAMIDGPTVTGLRTAAVSLLAIDCLAPAVDDFLLLGTGTQALHHLRAIVERYPAARVRIRGTSVEAAERLCARVGRGFDVAAASHDTAASVVVTCTTSRTPVYREAARADRLLVAVGSFQPGAAEIAAVTVRGSTVYVDDPRGAPHEAGDLIQAGVDWRQVRSLADLVRGADRPDGPVLFKSVGCAAWDLAAARVALRAMRGAAA